MPTSITSSGITFDDATTQTTSATKAGGIGTTQLADSSVTTAKINNAAVTAAKLDNVGQGAGNPPIYGCRAWVSFDGTRNATNTGASTNGANVRIIASANVGSVLKNATGDYTINFTTAMPDANYCMFGMTTGVTSGNTSRILVIKGTDADGPTNKTSSQVTITVGSTAAAVLVDMKEVGVAFLR